MILVKTPLRISFIGGSTDFEDFYLKHGGRVVSTTIDKYVYINISKKFAGDVRVSYSKTEISATSKDIKHTRVKEVLEKLNIDKGVEIVTVADLPSEGIGLGSSSAITVGLLQGLHKFKGNTTTDGQLANEACEVEIDTLKEPIGKQDQYAVAFGGMNMFDFNKDGTIQVSSLKFEPRIIKGFQEHLMFFYTGITRSASSILKQQKEKLEDNVKVLKKVSSMVHPFIEKLGIGDFQGIGELFDEAWQLKKSLADGITDKKIDKMYGLAKKNGAYGGKILGAGGGGFLMVLAPPQFQDKIRSAIPWQEVDIKFSNEGSKIVYED